MRRSEGEKKQEDVGKAADGQKRCQLVPETSAACTFQPLRLPETYIAT